MQVPTLEQHLAQAALLAQALERIARPEAAQPEWLREEEAQRLTGLSQSTLARERKKPGRCSSSPTRGRYATCAPAWKLSTRGGCCAAPPKPKPPSPMKLSTARPLIGCTPSRYSCEQTFALRAWSCANLRKAPLAEQVEALRHYPGLEPVYTAFAAKALRTNCPLKLQESAKELWRVTDRRSQHRPVVYRAAPHIAKHILA